ncbi:type I DNA topoisomerase [Acuticoccus sp.]|uniref:type I DNA topoisomerase n=1 Tax=Acuticoccus sp. TaxID=1904378 RepID=UPI003B5239F8
MNVVVVESPAKAKTINKYLGSDYHVVASYGHVRDLPPKDGSVDPERDFEMLWQVDDKAKKRLNELATAVKSAERLILATDPDREGEAISWHVLQVLREKKALKSQPVQRVVFNAITKQAVLDAMAAPREIEADLVDAYRARRALDYLVGFNLSPVLWRKLPGARSAGRVQSVALRLVCDREAEIERFRPQEYWSVVAALLTREGEEFAARVVMADGERLDRLAIRTEADAARLVRHLEAADFRVASVEAKPQRRNPSPPFTTSTLQQEASRKLGFSSARTMQTAQRLYEGIDLGGETVGLITYMRTDGVQMAPEGIAAIRSIVGREYGEAFLPDAPRHYATKAKNAQEAHEAIRPTDVSRLPADLRRRLDDDQARLYDLIWKRAVASQMMPAEFERTTVDIDATVGGEVVGLRATGSVMKFAGFMKAYSEGRDEPSEEDDENRLPQIGADERLTRRSVTPSQHFTEPPPRYTEATLIKRMEELGIGRPSTYTATLSTLQDRDYVTIDKKRLVPGSKGRIVTAFLQSFFERYVEYGFTAELEEKLDAISDGKLDWREVLRDFWRDFSAQIGEVMDVRTAAVLDALNDDLAPLIFPPKEDGSDPRACPACAEGRLSLKNGRYGAFIGCSNYPDCNYVRQLGDDPNAEGAAAQGPVVLGAHPVTGREITLRSGRFGPYVEMAAEAEEKPARSSLPKGWAPDEVTLEKAVMLVDLPREVGIHPETHEPIQAGLGRYGPFLLHGGKYTKLESVEDVFEVGLNRAVALIAERKDGQRFSRTPASLKSLGEHPSGGEVTVREGRYGPYVNHGKVNATLPKGSDPQSITLAEALALLEAKSGKPAKPAKSAKSKAKADQADAKGAKAAQAPGKGKAAGGKKAAAKGQPAAGRSGKGKAASPQTDV